MIACENPQSQCQDEGMVELDFRSFRMKERCGQVPNYVVPHQLPRFLLRRAATTCPIDHYGNAPVYSTITSQLDVLLHHKTQK